jgi:hypothetical protein
MFKSLILLLFEFAHVWLLTEVVILGSFVKLGNLHSIGIGEGNQKTLSKDPYLAYFIYFTTALELVSLWLTITSVKKGILQTSGLDEVFHPRVLDNAVLER